MPVTVDRKETKDRTVSRLADLTEDAAYLALLFAGIMMVVALIAAFVV